MDLLGNDLVINDGVISPVLDLKRLVKSMLFDKAELA